MVQNAESYSKKVWEVLSYIVFVTLFAIVWRNLYIQSQQDIDAAFVGVKEPEDNPDKSPLDRYIDLVLLRTPRDKEPPYNFVGLITNVFIILVWLIFYNLLIVFVCLFLDLFIIKNSMQKEVKEQAENHVVDVLSEYIMNNFAFILHSCMICISFVILIAIIIHVAFIDLVMEKDNAKMIAQVIMIIVLISIPLVSLTNYILDPVLKLLKLKS